MFNPRVHELNISDDDFSQIKKDVWAIVKNDTDYPKKIRAKNFYKKLSPHLLKRVESILSLYSEIRSLTWYFEIFFSMDPVGLHNDRNFFRDQNELCDKALIIPLEWSGDIPKTRFYDLYIEEKVNWDGKGFKTLDGLQIQFPQESLQKSIDLSWQEKTILFFDSRQIHDASKFQKKTADYKLSINALGYSNP